jgi:hypothetical protein
MMHSLTTEFLHILGGLSSSFYYWHAHTIASDIAHVPKVIHFVKNALMLISVSATTARFDMFGHRRALHKLF